VVQGLHDLLSAGSMGRAVLTKVWKPVFSCGLSVEFREIQITKNRNGHREQEQLLQRSSRGIFIFRSIESVLVFLLGNLAVM